MKKFEVVLNEPCRPALVEIGKEEQLDCLQKQEESENKETKVQRLSNALRKILSSRTDIAKVTVFFVLSVGRIFSIFSSVCFSLIYAEKSYINVKSLEYIFDFLVFFVLSVMKHRRWVEIQHGKTSTFSISLAQYLQSNIEAIAVTHFISKLLFILSAAICYFPAGTVALTGTNI